MSSPPDERGELIMLGIISLAALVSFAFWLISGLAIDLERLRRITSPRLIVINETPAGGVPAGADGGIEDQAS